MVSATDESSSSKQRERHTNSETRKRADETGDSKSARNGGGGINWINLAVIDRGRGGRGVMT